MNDKIERTAKVYADKLQSCYQQVTGDVRLVAKLGFQAGAQWAGKPENVTDEQIMAVLNAVGYEEHCWIDVVRADIKRRYGNPN